MTSSAWWRADAVSEQENLGVVDKAYEAFGQGDVAGVLDLLAEDALVYPRTA